MKKFSSALLCTIMLLNLGFAFSEAESSAISVPLSVIGNETQPFGSNQGYVISLNTTSPNDLRRALHRITYLEALLTGSILGQNIGFQNDINSTPTEAVRAALYGYESTIAYVTIQTPILIDAANSQIVTNRIAEIKAKINIVDLRIADLKGLLKAFILGVPYSGGPVSGIDSDPLTGDINIVKQELFRARRYRSELEVALRFWAHLIDSNEADLLKIISINPNKAKAGNIISIDGDGFSKAFAVILSGTNVDKRIEIPANSILSNTRISFTVPNLSGITGDLPIKISVVDDEASTVLTKSPNFTYQGNTITCSPPPSCPAQTGCSYTNIPKDSNGCVTGCGTLSCPNGDSCRCPSGQVYITVGVAKRCIVFNTGSVTCSRYGNHPVCGCDGMTYQNSCYALINGLKTYTDGVCN